MCMKPATLEPVWKKRTSGTLITQQLFKNLAKNGKRTWVDISPKKKTEIKMANKYQDAQNHRS